MEVSPGAALIRARAKAPLPDLQVLHLSNAVIECIKHLELCKCLQSLYADNNRIRDVEGVIQLRKLWRIDLNGNLLKDLQALASFRTLGFLYLERNRICFEDLICLRDQHVLELRLLGNKSLMKGNSIHEYRKKVVALLPNVWILDGHFISTTERQQAIEEFDPFVANLRQSAIGNRKFGSETDMWMDMERISKETVLTPGTRLIKTTHKTANPQEAPDLTRFHAIVAFHNDESAIHNAYCQFAPSRHSPNSQLMPKIWLDEILALPRRTRIEVMVLLAVFLQFRFPKVLLTEALTIRQLDSPQFPSEAIRDTVNLPPYALVALIAITRHVSLETEHSMREELKPETTTPEFEDESKLLGAIPPLFTTLFSSSDTAKPVGETDPQSTAIRCRQAIKLLSIVASFPDPEIVAIKGKGKREAIFRELAPLFRAAEAESSGRKPKPGDWVELHSKQFVKIQFLSGDGLFVVGAFPTDTSRSITIPLKQISRISNSVWRANSSAMQQTEELFQRARSDRLNNPQLGKLHRDSEAFHRHGAARNQGFPNHFVTAQVLEALEQEESNAAPSLSRTKAVEIFSSNDTLDANYVLASPAHISAQNYCAFIQQHHQPRGIWSPVKQPAPYSILASKTPTLGKSSSLNELKTKPHFQKPNSVSRSQPLDDWHEIRRAMQAQLGIVDDIKRPLTTSSSTTSLQTSSECFITAPPNCCITTEDLESAPIVRFRVKTPPVLQQKLTVARDWRQIATKTEFVVAASPDAQLTRGTPGPITTPKLKSAILPSISHKNVPLTCSK
ncbi:Protein tilB [Phytophthora citrophthora]|uniref:Protein tilB n=1 Tax=Phytophthora citrophthora TaxID=4793 RepID=A0AAD9GY85_9STRA|nr:Protein tilB [Phytophthora citrophthora]